MNSEKLLITNIQGTRIANTNNLATLNDYFHIGSCSKSVLATIAARMIETGKIKWDTKFFDIFPELKAESNVEFYNITLEDLFLCKAGIKAYTSGEEFPPIDSAVSNKRLEFIKYLLRQETASERTKNGKFKHLYSNASYTIASAMLEKIASMNYEKLIEHYIVQEMGLNVYIGWPNSFDPNQPWGHTINGKKLEKFPPEHEYGLPYLLTPAGDLSMSPVDFSSYIQLHLKGLVGKDNFIKTDSYKYIHYRHNGFSLGVVNGKLSKHSYSGIDGSAGTFFCRAIVIPDSDFAFTIMMNAGSGKGQMKAVDWLTMEIIKKKYNWWWKFWI